MKRYDKIIVFVSFLLLIFSAALHAAVLKIVAEPRRLNADQDQIVIVSARLNDDKGRGLPGREILFLANSGAFAPEVEDLGGGAYRATLTVPARSPRQPDNLLILASAKLDGVMPVAGLRIPIYANLVLKGRAAAGTEMQGRRQGRALGDKAVADAQGRFVLTLPVQPGDEKLQVVARKNGAEKINTLDLKLSPRHLAAVQVAPGVFTAGGPPGFVNMMAVAADGTPAKNANFILDCGPGDCDKPMMLSPGVFQARYTPPGTPPPSEKTQVRVHYANLIYTADALILKPGLAELTLTADKQEAFPGESVALEITASDRTGNPLPGAVIRVLSQDGAPLGSADDTGAGTYRLTFNLSAPNAEKTISLYAEGVYSDEPENPIRSNSLSINLKAPDIQLSAEQASDTPAASNTIELQAQALPAASIEVTADPAEVFIPGAAETRVTVTVKNRLGGPVAGEPVAITLKQDSSAETARAETGTDGRAEMIFSLKPPAGQAVATAASEKTTSLTNSVTITKRAYPVSRMEMTAAAASIPADGATTIEVEALAVDEAGNNAQGERLDFRLISGSGRISAAWCATGDDGRCRTYYTAGTRCGTVSIDSFVYTQDTIRANAQISEIAKIPAALTLVENPGTMVCNGVDTWTLLVDVTDAGGCPVANEQLRLTLSGGGSLASGATTNADGKASAVYTAGITPGTVTLTAQSVTSPLLMLSVDVNMEARPPAAAITLQSASANISTGRAVDFTGTSSSAVTPATLATYIWDFNGDAITDSAAADPPAYTYNTAGGYTASLTVTDSIGFSNTTTTAVNVYTLPTAVITLQSTSTNIGAGQSVNFTGANSSAAAPAILAAYNWDFNGDGVIDSTLADPPAYTYNTAGSYTVSLTVNDNLNFSHTTTTTVTVTTINTPPTSVITLQSLSATVCANDSVDFTGTGSIAVTPAALVAYQWDFDGDSVTDSNATDPPAHTYTAPGNYTVSLSVTDSNSQNHTATTTVAVSNIPSSAITLTANPTSVNANGVHSSSIQSGVILACGGAAVANGTLFTVATSRGTITTADASAGTSGIQISSTGGVIAFTVQANTTPGTATIAVKSTDNFYSGDMSLPMTANDNTRPTVVSFSPAGIVGAPVTQIVVVFSEAMSVTDFTVNQGGAVAGTWIYSGASFTAVFTPAVPIPTGGQTTVTVKQASEDLEGNALDGKYTGAPNDFSFAFGSAGTLGCTPPVVESTSVNPASFSPDGDTVNDTTTITYHLTDNHHVDYWQVLIMSGGTVVRNLMENNACAEANPGCCCGISRTYQWDGRDEGGNIVDNGNYTYQVKAYDIVDCNDTEPPAPGGAITVDNPIDFGSFGP